VRKFVIIVNKSAGNESVGEMWVETHIFKGTATLDGVLAALGNDLSSGRHTVRITFPTEQPVKPSPDDDNNLPF